MKQEVRIVAVKREDEDDEIDELAGDYEGKPWHPSTSLCTHARHNPPSLTNPRRDGNGPSAKDTIRFRAR